MATVTDPIMLDSTGQAIKNSIDLLTANINRTASNIPYDSNLTIKGKIDEVDAKMASDIPYSSGVSVKNRIDNLIKVEQTTISVTVSANSHLWSGRVKPSDTSYSWYLYSVIPLDSGLLIGGYNDDGILVRNVTNSAITANLNQRWFGILN